MQNWRDYTVDIIFVQELSGREATAEAKMQGNGKDRTYQEKSQETVIQVEQQIKLLWKCSR